jgi:PhnB protein
MDINPYLSFPGTCAEALAAYADILGGEITFSQTFGESPVAEHMPPETHAMIMHANLTVGSKQIMASDAPPDRYQRPQGTYVSLQIDDVATARAAFDRLAEGGEIQMPFEKTFWAAGFGMLVDRFGIPWMINCNEG